MPLTVSKENRSPVTQTPLEVSRRVLLLVDDDASPRQALSMLFRDEYRVLVAENGFQALQILSENCVDAAILDIRMPGMNGIELLERIKRFDPAIEVIMLTAYETLDTTRNALRLGACDYLNKPVDARVIRSAVASAMDRRTFSDQVRANTQRLQALQEEITDQRMDEEMARRQGEIYASIIHDINNPLTIISGLIELINEQVTTSNQLSGSDMQQLRERLGNITRQVTSCIDISRRYLGFLRQRSEGRAVIAVNELLRDVENLLCEHPGLKRNRFSIELLPREVQVEMNATDLIQMLVNLVNNAVQCSDRPHLIEIKATLQSPVGAAGTHVEGLSSRWVNRERLNPGVPLVALSVRDDGPGIPAEIVNRIFEPYFTTKGRNEGTGLGLAIVRRLLVESHAALRLDTAPGVGTCFTILLPVKDPGSPLDIPSVLRKS